MNIKMSNEIKFDKPRYLSPMDWCYYERFGFKWTN